MIHYQLCCGDHHSFDGWFRSSADFERQAATRLIGCPVCGSVEVERALMAPSICRSSETPTLPACIPPQGGLPDQARAMLQKLRSAVERHCEDVGENFPEQVRSMYYGETEKRGVYGKATADEAEALADEGIEIAVIPWVPLADS
jgi:hypothetical protein